MVLLCIPHRQQIQQLETISTPGPRSGQMRDTKHPFSFFQWSWPAMSCTGSKTPWLGTCTGGIQLKTCQYDYSIITRHLILVKFPTWTASELVQLWMIDYNSRQIDLGISFCPPPPRLLSVNAPFADQSQNIYGTGSGAPIEAFEQDAPHSPVLHDRVLMHLHIVASKQMEPILMACFALIRVY